MDKTGPASRSQRTHGSALVCLACLGAVGAAAWVTGALSTRALAVAAVCALVGVAPALIGRKGNARTAVLGCTALGAVLALIGLWRVTAAGDGRVVAAAVAALALGAIATISSRPAHAAGDARGSAASLTPPPRIGGQAVIEGVMMRGRDHWAVAVRAPGGAIRVTAAPLPAWSRRGPTMPWVRGLVAVAETLSLGTRALRWSAAINQGRPEPTGSIALRLAGTAAVAVTMFVVVPAAIATSVFDASAQPWRANALEGGIRLSLFLGYLAAIGLAPSVRRVLEYHGAEHKVIAVHEGGGELCTANVRRASARHVRCGTDFLLLVVVLTIVVQAALPAVSGLALVASRLLVLVLVTGLGYEVIRLAGRTRIGAVRHVLAGPGLALQRLTTREPSDDQIEVALAALDAAVEQSSPTSGRSGQ
ncbi:MAG: DUF1385 domain-containing protein [Acidimicrobiia bacterium]